MSLDNLDTKLFSANRIKQTEKPENLNLKTEGDINVLRIGIFYELLVDPVSYVPLHVDRES